MNIIPFHNVTAARGSRKLSPLFATAVSNNGRTQNFQTLLCKLLELVSSTQKQPTKAAAATNAVYLVRVLFKNLSESLNAVQLAAFSTDTPYTAAEIQPSKRLVYLGLLIVQRIFATLYDFQA